MFCDLRRETSITWRSSLESRICIWSRQHRQCETHRHCVRLHEIATQRSWNDAAQIITFYGIIEKYQSTPAVTVTRTFLVSRTSTKRAFRKREERLMLRRQSSYNLRNIAESSLLQYLVLQWLQWNPLVQLFLDIVKISALREMCYFKSAHEN